MKSTRSEQQKRKTSAGKDVYNFGEEFGRKLRSGNKGLWPEAKKETNEAKLTEVPLKKEESKQNLSSKKPTSNEKKPEP